MRVCVCVHNTKSTAVVFSVFDQQRLSHKLHGAVYSQHLGGILIKLVN